MRGGKSLSFYDFPLKIAENRENFKKIIEQMQLSFFLVAIVRGFACFYIYNRKLMSHKRFVVLLEVIKCKGIY